MTTLDHPPTQLDPPEPARLPRAAPRTGIPQRGLRACHGSGESSLEAAWPPPVAPPQPPNTASARPQHPREQPRHRRRSSAHGATCQHSERACERLDQGQGEGRFELRGALTRRYTACFRPRRPPGTPRGANPAGSAPRRVGRRKDSCWTAHRMSRPTAVRQAVQSTAIRRRGRMHGAPSTSAAFCRQSMDRYRASDVLRRCLDDILLLPCCAQRTRTDCSTLRCPCYFPTMPDE